MTKTTLGTKRTCVSCSANFYDLNKNPATCPKCEHTFDTTAVVKAKRKSAKRGASEVETPSQATILAPRNKVPAKKIKSDDDDDSGLNDLIELDDSDDIESLHELSELEEMEESAVNEDDADEEALIEDTGKNTLVGSVEEEEAMAHVDDLDEDEEEADEPVAKKKPKKK